MSTYKTKFSLEHREKESSRVRSKYVDRIPVIVEPSSSRDVCIDKNKYLVPCEFTLGQLVYIIRKRVSLSPEKSMFVFVNSTIPHTSATISSIYDEHCDKDGFLYLLYTTEMNTFGAS
jgi:GABA(A) receptor-associated protein